MEKLTDKQKAVLGVVIIVVPGAALAFGTYLLYNGIKTAIAKKKANESEEKRILKHFEDAEPHAGLFPKWNCPKCGDWFHMPYKNCKCGGSK